MAGHRAVLRFLAGVAVGPQEGVDEEVVHYLTSVLESVADIDELLSGMLPQWESLGKGERLRRLIDLHASISHSSSTLQQQQGNQRPEQQQQQQQQGNQRPEQPQEAPGGAEGRPTEACVLASSLSGLTLGGTAVSDTSSSSTCGSDISYLLELCGGSLSADFLAHILKSTFLGDQQRCVEWLLDCPDPKAQEQAWRASQRQRKQQLQDQQLAEQKQRRRILERFDLQPVGAAAAVAQGSGGKDIRPLDDKSRGVAAGKGGGLRYLDGQVVSHKGERFVVQQLGQEWDGGSKGKVYTKGKRGKGFV